MTNSAAREQLISALLEQPFAHDQEKNAFLTKYKKLAEGYVNIDNCLAVLSDFEQNCSYLFVGSFGQIFGLPEGNVLIDSAFEDCIFSKIHAEDITDRHILELSYFRFQQGLPVDERKKYSTISRIRALNAIGEYNYISHRTIYVKSLPNNSVWLALCIYGPSSNNHPAPGIDGKIINSETGEIIIADNYKQFAKTLLTRREKEVLILLARGMKSNAIAEMLHISIYTVRRHRQNVLEKMQVSNATEAVKTAIGMGIIPV